MTDTTRIRSTIETAFEAYEFVMTGLFLSLLVLIVVQILSRNLPPNPYVGSGDFLWIGETVESVIIFIIFLGAPIAEYRGRQIQVDLISDRIQAGVSRQYLNLLDLAVVLFAALITRTAYSRAVEAWDSTLQNAPLLTFGHLYGTIAVGFGLVGLVAAGRIATRIDDRFDVIDRIGART